MTTPKETVNGNLTTAVVNSSVDRTCRAILDAVKNRKSCDESNRQSLKMELRTILTAFVEDASKTSATVNAAARKPSRASKRPWRKSAKRKRSGWIVGGPGKTRQFKRFLGKYGFVPRSGGKHEVWTHASGESVALPRGKSEIGKGLAASVARDVSRILSKDVRIVGGALYDVRPSKEGRANAR